MLCYSGFEITVEKPNLKQLLQPIATGVNSAMNQSESLAMNYNLLKVREKSRLLSAIDFGFALLDEKLARDFKVNNCRVITII